MRRTIEVEGYTPEELLALPADAIRSFVFSDEPLTFRIGTAEVLGAFRITDGPLVVELAHIDGGREGVLVTIALCSRYAKMRALAKIEWIVHAVHCARPNVALRRVLENRGFQVRHISGVGHALPPRRARCLTPVPNASATLRAMLFRERLTWLPRSRSLRSMASTSGRA